MTSLLITGGAGFIGSHTCVVLLEAGHQLIVLDDFSNSSPVALERTQELGGGSINCIRGDIRDPECLNGIFKSAQAAATPIEAVIHFAGLKAVGESVAEPLRYWDVNLCGSRTWTAQGSLADMCRDGWAWQSANPNGYRP